MAELTGKNPNVFYELGLAHALNKPVILVAQTLDDLPFDLRHLRTIIYSTQSVDWSKQLYEKVVSSARDFLSRSQPSQFMLATSRDLIERRKVDTVRWHTLSAAEQADLYVRFNKLRGRYNLPTRPLAPNDAQVALQDSRPIDLGLLEDLRTQFAPHISSVSAFTRYPMTMEELLEIRKLHDPISDGIEKALNKGLAEAEYLVFRRLYDYLFSPEWHPTLDEQRDCDLVVVLGARRGHSHRVDAALQIVNSAHNARLFLTGG